MSTEKNLQNMIDLMQRDDSVDAPIDSRRWASNLFRTRAAQPKASLIKRLAAVLMMEIAPNKPAFGERSASMTTVRQLLYQAEDNAIDIRIEPAQKGFSVRGQILGNEFTGATARLFDDQRTFESDMNDLSEFRFDSVPEGEYDLSIHGNVIEITLKSIDVS